MKNPKSEIREYLTILIKHILFIKGLKKQLSILEEWQTPNRYRTLDTAAYFLRLVTYSFNRTILIELCKLLLPNEERSLVDFLNKSKEHITSIEPLRYNSENHKRELVPPNEYLKMLEEHSAIIDSKKESISKIKAHRDKVLTHSDASYFSQSEKIYIKYPLEIDEINDLIETASEIMRSNYALLMESDLEIEIHSLSNVDTLLINTRAFKRVLHDKRAKALYPYIYKLDEYKEKLKEFL